MLTRSLALLLTTVFAASANWSNWRGPNFNGSTDASNLPTELKANVKWELATLEGASTPIVDDSQIYLTAVDRDKQELVVFAVDRKTGETVWEDRPSTGFTVAKGTPISLHNRSNYASPSAVTDGERVIFSFGNGDFHSYTLTGEKQWSRNLQKDFGIFTYQWTYSATPLLHKGTLYVALLQRDKVAVGIGKDGNESFLLAIDPATGKDMWKHIRPSDAVMESLEAFGTPLPYTENGREEIILFGGDVLTGHDPKTGKELWRWGTWNPGHKQQWWRTVPSAVAGGGAVLACAPKKAPVFAAKTGLSGTHEGENGKLWNSKGGGPVSTDVPTPAYADGAFFVLSDVQKAISRVDPKTGDIAWTTKLPGREKWRASPTVADGKVWLMNHGGSVAIVDAKNGAIIKTEKLGDAGEDNARATIAIADNTIYIRTLKKLYCISN